MRNLGKVKRNPSNTEFVEVLPKRVPYDKFVTSFVGKQSVRRHSRNSSDDAERRDGIHIKYVGSEQRRSMTKDTSYSTSYSTESGTSITESNSDSEIWGPVPDAISIAEQKWR